MFLYKNIFENIKTINCNFPIEDQYYANENEAIVADGITRDPIGISNLNSCSFEDMLKKYPRPSGAEMAAKEICSTFKKSTGTLKEKLINCNKKVKQLNDIYIKNCDYLENDYYGAVASCVKINKDVLHYAYICDCGVIVYDKTGKIKFQTEDDKELYSDPYINEIGIPWYLPEARIIVRKNFRNNINTLQDGKCVSYGALTGEESANKFIKEGTFNLEDNDYIIVYSDGLTNFLHDKDFINKIINFNKIEFESYINEKSKESYEKYGKEKTMIIYKIELN